MIAVLVSSALSQPERTLGEELPVQTGHKALEAIQEALQNIRCNSLTRASATEALQQQQRAPSVTPASCHRRCRWVCCYLNLCDVLRAIPPVCAQMLGQQSKPRQARSKAGATDTQRRSVLRNVTKSK